MSTRALRKSKGATEQINWELFGDEIVYKVGRAPSAHADSSLYELAEEFAEWSYSDITEKDLELLREMPRDVYKKYEAKQLYGW